MNKLALLLLIPGSLFGRTYSTLFPLTENPISESANWTNSSGDWGAVRTTPGLAFGVSLPTQYGDPTAIVSGSWGATQTVQAVVHVGTVPAQGEVELRLRTTLSAGVNSGYEMLCPTQASPGYGYQIVRWNGAEGQFVYIGAGATHQCVDGDVLVGRVYGTSPTYLEFYNNGTLVASACDNGQASGGSCGGFTYSGPGGAAGPFTTGNPGMGFYDGVDSNWSYFGFAAFIAYDSDNNPWGAVLSGERAIDWTKAGLPASYPDGETTPNPWTPPTRTACVATPNVTGTGTSADVTNIVNAIASCNNGTYIMLHGNFSITAALRIGASYTSNHNNVTLRGDGPMSTTLTMASTGYDIQIGAQVDAGSGYLTNNPENFLRYQTKFIVAGATGTGSLVANNVARFIQCDDGLTPSSRPVSETGCTGSVSDPGGIFVCRASYCASNGGIAGSGGAYQQQLVKIVSATNNGDGTWTVVTDPGLYMPNWSYAKGATLIWNSTSYTATGMGMEDLTIRLVDSGGSGDTLQMFGLGNWYKGLRIIGYNNSWQLVSAICSHCLQMNNYFFGSLGSDSSLAAGTQGKSDGDVLILNNISQMNMFIDDDGDRHQGNVQAYNYSRDVFTDHYQATMFEHEGGSIFVLREGNDVGRLTDDSTWSSHNFNAMFRNYMNCADYPYQIAGQPGGGIQVDSWSRFENLIGNVIGVNSSASYRTNKCAQYSAAADDGYAFGINGSSPQDSTGLTVASLVRWGNVTAIQQGSDTPANSGIRFVASENSNNSDLSTWPAAIRYDNLPSPSTNLPCSLFMPDYMATSCAPKYSGGTGLSWWKVCDTWSTFPTSCSHYTTPPFPANGPDILASGGAPTNYANDIPAHIAWSNLPIDTSFQNSYTVTGSSWSSGVETLNVSGLPTGNYTMGPFTLTGANSACNPTGGELQMSASTTTTVSYLLTSSPGVTCTGTMKWPNVRQFDQRVYALDSGGASVPAVTLSPGSLNFGTQQIGATSSSLPVQLTNSGDATLNISSITISGDFTIFTNTCGSTLAASASCVVSPNFTPIVSGARTGTLTFNTDASTSPDTVSLSGTGAALRWASGLTITGVKTQ